MLHKSLVERLKQIEIEKDHLLDVRTNLEHNKPILKFYNRLLFNTRFTNNSSYRETVKKSENYNPGGIVWNLPYVKISTLENSISNISNCNNLWLLNVYDTAKVKDFLKTNLCKDRFCNNCKKVKQASRMARFLPEIAKVSEGLNLYHLTLTVPNCSGSDLRKTVDKMTKSFSMMNRYLRGDKNIRGIDFMKYGYNGAIRSLEVTFKRDSYHPHFHIMLALDYKEEEKTHVNSFSMRHGKMVRKFSNFEILIQKIWYLLMNDVKVTLSHINNIALVRKQHEENLVEDIGYSCSMDEFQHENYKELFKYMTKSFSDDENYFTFKNFCDLYFQLKGVRQIQGYGCFFRIKDIDVDEEVDSKYNLIIDTLNSMEDPRVSTEKTEDLWMDDEYMLISRKRVYGYLRDIENEEKKRKESANSSQLLC